MAKVPEKLTETQIREQIEICKDSIDLAIKRAYDVVNNVRLINFKLKQIEHLNND